MTPSQTVRCEGCRHWDTSVSSVHDQDHEGACRRNPPFIDMRTGHATWPLTTAADWCAEGEADNSESASAAGGAAGRTDEATAREPSPAAEGPAPETTAAGDGKPGWEASGPVPVVSLSESPRGGGAGSEAGRVPKMADAEDLRAAAGFCDRAEHDLLAQRLRALADFYSQPVPVPSPATAPKDAQAAEAGAMLPCDHAFDYFATGYVNGTNNQFVVRRCSKCGERAPIASPQEASQTQGDINEVHDALIVAPLPADGIEVFNQWDKSKRQPALAALDRLAARLSAPAAADIEGRSP